MNPSIASTMARPDRTVRSVLPDNGFAFQLNPGQPDHKREAVASFVQKYINREKDPAADVPGAPPLFGQNIVPQAMTFTSLIGSYAKTYLPSDEALESGAQDSLLMRKDLTIMECLEIRQRMVALLDWSIVPEDGKSPAQRSIAAEITKIFNRIKFFTEYRRSMQEAIWVGRWGMQHSYGYESVGGRKYVMPRGKCADDLGWEPIHGDKLIFRYDDGRKMPSGAYPNQLGIRVSATMPKNVRLRGMPKIEATNSGMAIFLSPAERQKMLVHKHMIEDAEFTNPRAAGRIHGVGIRDRIYRTWWIKQELLGFLMEYCERSAGGIEIYEYPSGDEAAKLAIMEAAKNRMSNGRNQLFFPKPLGSEAGNPYDLRIVELGFQGMDMLLNLIDKFFGHQIKRLILGQTLSTEADATGLGSGLSDLHKDTLYQIIRYDALNHQETITHQLLRLIHIANWPDTEGWQFKFQCELESDDMKEKLDSYRQAWEMGLAIPEKDVAEAIGVSLDNPNEKMLRKADQDRQAMANGMQFPAGTGFGGKDYLDHHKAVTEAKDQAKGEIIGKLGGNSGGGSSGDGMPESGMPAPDADQYARQMAFEWKEEDHPRDERGRFEDKDELASEPAPESPSSSAGTGNGRVKMRQAKAGGEVSEVDGKFYKGGKLMPVHGLYSGQEKAPSKPKDSEKLGELPTAKEDGKGFREVRKLSPEEIERRAEELKERAEWLNVQSGPLSELMWVGEKPGKYGFNVERQMIPFLKKLTNDQIQQIGDFAFDAFMASEVEKYPDIDRKLIEEDFDQQMNSTASMFVTKKLGEEFPAMARTVEALRQYAGMDGGKLKQAADLNQKLVEVLSPKPSSSSAEKTEEPLKIKKTTDELKKWMNGQALMGKMGPDEKREWLGEFGVISHDTNRRLRYTYELSDGRVVSAENALKLTNPEAYERLKRAHRSLTTSKARADLFNELPDEIRKQMIDDIPFGEIAKTAKRDVRKAIDDWLTHDGHLLGDGAWSRIPEVSGEIENRVGWIKEAGDSAKGTAEEAVSQWKHVHRNSFHGKSFDIGVLEKDGKFVATLNGNGKWNALKGDGWSEVAKDQYQRRSHRLLSEAAAQTDTSPTPSQVEAGNYSKGVFAWKGMEIAIENPKGSERTGIASSGRRWSRTMASHYGYFRRTVGADDDQLDVYIGNHPDSEFVLVIKQIDQQTGKFDEFKVVIGCLNRKEAKRVYLANYPKGWKCGPAAGMTVDLFKKWVASGGPTRAASIKNS